MSRVWAPMLLVGVGTACATACATVHSREIDHANADGYIVHEDGEGGVVTRGGAKEYAIECSGALEECYARASEVCPAGFSTLDDVSQPTGAVMAGTGNGSGFAAIGSRRAMRIACKDPHEPDPTQAPAAAPPRVEPPQQVAGFAFGGDVAQVQKTCEDAGFAFSNAGSRRQCAGTPSAIAGLALEARFTFCAERLCGVVLVPRVAPNDGAAWKRAYLALHDALSLKYGGPTQTAVELPAGCRSARELDECLVRGKARLRADWVWSPGRGIVLRAGKSEKKPLVRLTYAIQVAEQAL